MKAQPPEVIRQALAAADAAPDDLEALDQARRTLAWWRDRLVKRQSCGKHGDRRRARSSVSIFLFDPHENIY